MAARHLLTGASGERAAEGYLRGLGWRVIDRNWRCKGLELDLVCEHGDTLVFVEVKTRGEGSLGSAAEALDRTKQGRLARAARLYLTRTERWSSPCRFDLVAVTRSGSGFELEHVENAFDLTQAVGGGHAAWQPW